MVKMRWLKRARKYHEGPIHGRRFAFDLDSADRPGASKERSCDIEKPSFWDVVVLTTYDDDQKKSLEEQIQFKKCCGHFPEVPIHVIPDPEGQKLGVGGSTLHVLTELLKDYGSDLYSKKTLIIHSGGKSQRLPNYSVLGKIFSPVPCEGLWIDQSVPQMLDLKFAMYMPFSQILGPGVFVTCSDDIETYSLDMDALDLELLKSSDVVALAHPSDLTTGEGHGVYVFEDSATNPSNFVNSVQECKEVLQKPSSAVMRERGAVLTKDDGEEEVWSDSIFWLSEKVCKALVAWYTKNSPISCELDAYAHFLPCMGTRMCDKESGDFEDFRADMLPIFKECKLRVLALRDSRFYHLGTMEEYLSHMTVMDDFSYELGLVKNSSNCKVPFTVKGLNDAMSKEVPNRGTLLETYFGDSSVKISLENKKTKLVIENCQIFMPFYTNGNTIISNCVIKKCASVTFKCSSISIFDNLLYHTVPVKYNKLLLYVTVAFDLTASMKKPCVSAGDKFLFGCTLDEFIRILGYKEDDIRTCSNSLISLWTARLFMGSHSPEESFWLTHNTINQIRNHQNGEYVQTDISACSKTSLFSMKDVVDNKDLIRFMKEREALRSLITS